MLDLVKKWKKLHCCADRSSQLLALEVLQLFHPKNRGNSLTFKISL